MAQRMTRSGTVVVGALLLAALGGIAYVAWPAREEKIVIRGEQQRADERPLKLEPALANLGTHSPCEPPLKQSVTVTNKSDKPVTVKRIRASCACTSAELVGSRLINPGETRTLEVTVDLTGFGDKSQSVFLIEDTHPIGLVRVDYKIVAPVKAMKDAVDIGPDVASAEVIVVREDGLPVKLLSVEPNIGTIKTNADGSQVVVVDLVATDAYVASPEGKQNGSVIRDADGTYSGLYLSVVTDYPGCPNASVLVRRGR